MFVRFSKRNGNAENEKKYRRAVAINNTYLFQEGDDIVGFARLANRNWLMGGSGKTPNYRMWVLDCDHTSELERYFKRFIGNSAKWENQNYGKRKYSITYCGKEELKQERFKIDIY